MPREQKTEGIGVCVGGGGLKTMTQKTGGRANIFFFFFLNNFHLYWKNIQLHHWFS